MENIAKVRLLVTLKAGDKSWAQGSILEAPLPPAILNEIRVGRGTVEILKVTQPEKEPEKVSVPKRVLVRRKDG